MAKDGKSTKEIAELLHVGKATVDSHRNAIRQKLGLANEKVNPGDLSAGPIGAEEARKNHGSGRECDFTTLETMRGTGLSPSASRAPGKSARRGLPGLSEATDFF